MRTHYICSQSCLQWLLDTLATETEWQERLRKEVLEFREQHDNPTMDDYDNFKLLNAVVKVCGISHSCGCRL